jgi:hypothetical protein
MVWHGGEKKTTEEEKIRTIKRKGEKEREGERS